MIFVLFIVYGIVASVLIAKKKMKLSQTLLTLMAFTIISSIALGQNYTMSLISEVNDGIGVSNFLASFLLPEDRWTKEMFSRNLNCILACLLYPSFYIFLQ